MAVAQFYDKGKVDDMLLPKAGKSDLGYMPMDDWAYRYGNSSGLEEGVFVYGAIVSYTLPGYSGSLDGPGLPTWNSRIPFGKRYFKYDFEISMQTDSLSSMTWPASWVWIGHEPTYSEMNSAYSSNHAVVMHLSCRLDCNEPSTPGDERKTLVEFRGFGARSR